MKNRYTLIAVLIACFAGVTSNVSAAYYSTVSSGEYAWDDPNAWVNGVIPPENINFWDAIDINCEVVLMTSLGNHGFISIKNGAVLTIYGGSNAKSLVNNGFVVVENNAIVRILRNQNAGSSPNILTNVMGAVILDGTLEILGGELINMSNIIVTWNGTIYNYGHQNGSNQVITSTGRVIDLDTYIASLDGTGRIAEPDVTDQNWTCLTGTIDNTMGSIEFQGGSFEDAECGGGGYTGPMLPSTSCGLISNIYTEGNLKNGIDLFWSDVTEAQNYVVGIQTMKGDYTTILKVTESTATIPASVLAGHWNVKYTIAAICDERVAAAMTEEEAALLLERSGITSSWDGASADMFPNPVTEVLYIQPQMDVVNTTLEVFDPAGRLIQSLDVEDGSDLINVDMSDVPAGTYIVKLNSGSDQIQKLIVVSE